MKLILLAYLLLALFCGPLRRIVGRALSRMGHALALWAHLGRPWRTSWYSACRRFP